MGAGARLPGAPAFDERSWLSASGHEPADGDEKPTPGEEHEVVQRLIRSRADMVDPENVVIQNALDEIEGAPSDRQ